MFYDLIPRHEFLFYYPGGSRARTQKLAAKPSTSCALARVLRQSQFLRSRKIREKKRATQRSRQGDFA